MKKYITILNNQSGAYPVKQVDGSKKLKEPNLLNNLVPSNNKHKKLLSPLVKEWPNSMYSYNNNQIEPSYHKSETINKMMRNYFNLIMIDKNSKNSKRMRDLIRRSSTKKLFVSRPDIKHNRDKVIYTLYVFNKEKSSLSRKIYLLNKSLNKFNKYKMYNLNYYTNMENRLKLNSIRPVNRLGTINQVLNSNLGWQQPHVLSKSYLYKPIIKDLPRSWFVNKATKSLVYYANSYSIVKQKSLLQLKTNKQTEERSRTKQVKKQVKSYYYRAKQNVFKENSNRMKSNLFLKKSLLLNRTNRYIPKNIVWRSLFKNKNNSYFSNKLSGLLALSFTKKQIKTFKSIFFFNFILWLLSRFNIKVIIKRNKLIIANSNDQLLEVKSNKIYTNPIKSYLGCDVIGTYSLPFFSDKQNGNIKTTRSENNGIESRLSKPANRLLKIKSLNKIKLRRANRFNNAKLNSFAVQQKKLKILNKVKLRLYNKTKLNRLNIINNILFKLSLLILKKGGVVNNSTSAGQEQENRSYQSSVLEKNMNFLFTHFKNRYLGNVVKNTLIKQSLGVHYLYRHSMNNLKYNKFLIALKSNLLKLYNKRPQINIVNLKYLQLNSDILLEAIAIKLKNKKTNLLRTLKKALKLIKLPQSLKNDNIAQTPGELNILNGFANHTKLTGQAQGSNSELQDLINVSLSKMFSNNQDTFEQNKSNVKFNDKNANDSFNSSAGNEIARDMFVQSKKRDNNLNSLKHKWVTGIKIEGKGRLTRRYRADRSLFKLKYKGSLKNINFKDVYDKKHLSLKKTQSMMLLQGQATPNIQYSFSKWKRHIGSYGIKGWISSN